MTAWFTALPWVYHLDFQRKERYHSARFEKDTRYYVIRLSKDLLEDWVITLINGRIKSKLGQSRTLAFANFNEAFDSFCQQAKIRHQRGYHLKTFDCDNHLLLHLLPFLVHAENAEEVHESKIIQNTKSRRNQNQSPAPTKSNQASSHQQMGFSF
ncbi:MULTISPECIES: WGR domain-containing protein [Fluoribacter]|uniref:WGR domain-containing protein n=1 Tax=Fluoribacter TaxID=461 RepID=UPI0010413E9E|nr:MULTISPECIES: WGR domain-containing protein [Fluoribacter]MCW8419957.1 WGR domain-containing protein [Fluoribacter dumoffii]